MNLCREVAEATALIQQWPKLPVEKALELLDYAYADQNVRNFAVRCLRDVTDDDLSLYLLQLAQALKHENYLACPLTEFLLKRALNNQRIGHFLFWHLRLEATEFACILFAYYNLKSLLVLLYVLVYCSKNKLHSSHFLLKT